MKTYYRKAPGCFIYTDVYYRQPFFIRGSFLVPFFSSLTLAFILSTFI